ncbi:MAG: recombinase family protein, partial [Candidatus Hydrogenedentes bacterium]|nr:recombinase family protein [Candidatus Hydrogenedentota bacterium]
MLHFSTAITPASLLDRRLHSLIPNDAECVTVAKIKRLRGQGKSYREIASYLNAKGIVSKNGGTWCFSAIRYVLANS